jgi:hypothetical protein
MVEAEIHAYIKNGNIYIDAKNTTGVTVTIPPQVDRNSALIICNSSEISINGKHLVNIQIKDNDAIEIDKFDDRIGYYKGTGLIDVYLSPMRIVNCSIGNEHYDTVSNIIQTPKVNIYDGITYVKYPILSEKVLHVSITNHSISIHL